jgi:hypothetical protein
VIAPNQLYGQQHAQYTPEYARAYAELGLVHLQYRFRVVSYSSGHEISNLRTLTFGKGA